VSKTAVLPSYRFLITFVYIPIVRGGALLMFIIINFRCTIFAYP